jgi:hypothetical protein
MGTKATHPQPDRTRPVFELGEPYFTQRVGKPVSVVTVLVLLSRHHRGDWGDLDPEDREANERALRTGGRLVSAYKLDDGRKVWVITVAEDAAGRRSHTTVLLPDEC